MADRMQSHRISEKIAETIERYSMFPPQGRIVAGVSGGADSMALAVFLYDRYRERLIVAHVNHLLRKEESDRDEAFVRAWCREHRIPCEVLRTDVAKLALQSGVGVEECGRKVRYDFFCSLAANRNDRIATAHTWSDSCETILLNLTRGAGANGLCGIPPVRGNIVRPFIALSREETECYCVQRGVRYMTDSTNASTEYARNRIRHLVMPALKNINPALEDALARLKKTMEIDEAYLSGLAKEAVGKAKLQEEGAWALQPLCAENDAVLLRALRQLARESGAEGLSEKHLSSLAACVRAGKGNTSLPGGFSAQVKGERLCFVNARADQRERLEWMIPFRYPKTLTVDGRTVIIETLWTPGDARKDSQYKFNDLLLYLLLDCDTITQDVVLRNRRDGDRFRPARRGVTKSLRKLFNENQVPLSKRDHVLILECGGEIVWVEGFGVAENFCATEKTVHAAQIRVEV